MKKIIPFLKKESSKDALRNILAIVIPSVILFYWLSLDFAIAFGVGVMLTALTDLPGNRQDKKTTAFWGIILFSISSFLASYSLKYTDYGILIVLALFGFLCNMIISLGPRIALVGNLTLIVISFTIGLRPADPTVFTIGLTLGCMFFYLINLVQVYLYPYRSLKYAMNEGFENMSLLIKIKIKCYDENEPLDQVYKQLTLLHIKISDQLEIIRSLVLREKDLIHPEREDQVWLNKIYRLIDLYELLMANDYDYDTIREQLLPTNALPLIQKALNELAEETKKVSKPFGESPNFNIRKDVITETIQELTQISNECKKEPAYILNGLVVHINSILDILENIHNPQKSDDATYIQASLFKKFVPIQAPFNSILKHINLKSPIFIYSLRMTFLILLAGLFGYFLPEFRYASWIILTIILVARPSYLITQRRNYQRIIGSIIGLVCSILILLITQNIYALLIIVTLSLYGFCLFNKPNYLICVIFITITIILGLNVYEGNIFDLLGSRIAFTLLGSVFAIIGCFALPINHNRTISSLSNNLINNYLEYWSKVSNRINGSLSDFYELRIARKNAQTSLAQTYDGLDQYLKDPRNRNQDKEAAIEFQNIAYRINALLIGLSVSIAKQNSEADTQVLAKRLSFIDSLIEELTSLSRKMTQRK